MTPVNAAVLELGSALYNWRKEPSSENIRALVAAAGELSTRALDLELRCAQAGFQIQELEPLERCPCGGTTKGFVTSETTK